MEKLNVLILEDEPLISFHIAQVVKSLDCNLLDIVTSFDDAMDISSKNRIDLLISDIKIIGLLDGIDVAKRVYELYNCEVLFLTAHIDDDTVKKASAVNSIGYLVKPFKEIELISILKMAIQRKQQNSIIELKNAYTYDRQQKELLYENKRVIFTKNESKLFNLIVNNINNLVSYDLIDEIIWYNKIVSDSNRRQLIFRLKNKLEGLNIEVVPSMGIYLKN